MSVTVDLKPMPDYLHATLSGEYADEEIRRVLKRIDDAANAQRVLKILMDCRDLIGSPTFEQRFALGQFFTDLRVQALAEGKTVGYTMAIVATPPLSHPDRTAIKPLLDRGLKVTVCETMEEALAWLEVA
jgi:hypothetical protein